MKIVKKLKKEINDPESEEIISVFEENMRGMPKFLDSEYDEKNNMRMLQASLDMINSLLPISEVSMKRFKNERASYAISTLLNQQREIANDIRSLQSYNERSDKIKDIVGKYMREILENLLDSASLLSDSLAKSLGIENDPYKMEKLKSATQDHLRNHGKYIVESNKAAEADIDGFILKTPTIPKTRKLLK